MTTLINLFSNYFSNQFRTTITRKSNESLYDSIRPSITPDYNTLTKMFLNQKPTLACLSEISVLLASHAPHTASFYPLLHRITQHSHPPIRSPTQTDPYDESLPSPSYLAPPSPTQKRLIPQLTHITGPLVLTLFGSSLIVTWHSPKTPQVYQSNIPLASLILISFMIHDHLNDPPSFSGTPPLTTSDIKDLTYDILHILNVDPIIFPLLPHIQSSSHFDDSLPLSMVDSSANLLNVVQCSYRTLLTMIFPPWYITQIPLHSSRNVSIKHHSEYHILPDMMPRPASFSTMTLTMDITPCYAAQQRLKALPPHDRFMSRHSLHRIQTFLSKCPLHIWMTILQNVFSFTQIECMPHFEIPPTLSSHTPIIYYHPRFGFYNDPDSSGNLTIDMMIFHVLEETAPPISQTGQAIHFIHREAIIYHAYHVKDQFAGLPPSVNLDIRSNIEASFGTSYHHRFIPPHSAPASHDIYWPFSQPVAAVHNS